MLQWIKVIKALADETRLKLIQLLLTHDLCVGALAHRLGVSEAAVSQHLQVLRKAGLIKGEKRGYWTHYSVEASVLKTFADELNAFLEQDACPEGNCPRAFSSIDISCRKEVEKMCQCSCQHPEKLKGKPEECTPEQIKECHGDTQGHPCEEEKE